MKALSIYNGNVISAAMAASQTLRILSILSLSLCLLQRRIHVRDINDNATFDPGSPMAVFYPPNVPYVRTIIKVRPSRHHGFTIFSSPICKVTKHGTTCIKIPGKDPDFNLTVYMDVETNPGPEGNRKSCAKEYHGTSPSSRSTPPSYSREALVSLRNYSTKGLSGPELRTLKELNILRYRGTRAGVRHPKQGYEQENISIPGSNDSGSIENAIGVRITNRYPMARSNRSRNLSCIRRIPYAKSYDLPTVLVSNTRALSNKVDELHQVATLNMVNVMCITETWLSQSVPDHAVSIPGFLPIFRNDRKNQDGGGVGIYVKENIPCKQLKEFEQIDVESLWLHLRPHALPRNISTILIGVVYHSTANGEAENVILREHIQRNIDTFLVKYPNAMVILVGDFNPISTGLRSDSICIPNHLKQLVTFYTRDTGTLDWFFTNRPHSFNLRRLPKLGLSDHYTILARPTIEPSCQQGSTYKIQVRQSRASNWREFGSWITTKDWSKIYSAPSCALKYQVFAEELNLAIDTFFPWKTVKKYTLDRPWITAKLKNWIAKRQTAFLKYGKDSIVYKFWRNRVQTGIKSAKQIFYHSKVSDLAVSNSKKWWNLVKSLTGQETCANQQWYNQFHSDTIPDNSELANHINNFFVSITDHFEPLLPVDMPPNVISSELFVSLEEVMKDLHKLDINKAVGPDGISNRLIKEFAPEFAPIIQDIYNQSLREGFVPEALKQSIVSPIPKVSPPQDIESDLRPISLTSCLAKVMEGFTHRRLLTQVSKKIDPRQYARHGHSTTHALIYLMQAIHEATDTGNCAVRIFFADFSKGFDIIDHNILLEELRSFDIDQTLFFWVRAFLMNRTQAVRIGSSLSSWKHVHGGVPQGTKLGITLFAIMINKLLMNWHLRTKYVDDSTVFEVVPRNSISMLDIAVADIQQYCINHRMKLNPKKCKEMVVNFMHNPNTIMRSICIGNHEVERVKSYKLLGVTISNDLKWNAHVDRIIARAGQRLYALRLLKRAGVKPPDIIRVYISNVRSILEYAIQVWQDIPVYLSHRIESIQKRALRIVYPNSSYFEALFLANLPTLESRRDFLCRRFISDMVNNHENPISFLVPSFEKRTLPYNLRSGPVRTVVDQKRTKRTEDFFTFRYTRMER